MNKLSNLVHAQYVLSDRLYMPDTPDLWTIYRVLQSAGGTWTEQARWIWAALDDPDR